MHVGLKQQKARYAIDRKAEDGDDDQRFGVDGLRIYELLHRLVEDEDHENRRRDGIYKSDDHLGAVKAERALLAAVFLAEPDRKKAKT